MNLKAFTTALLCGVSGLAVAQLTTSFQQSQDPRGILGVDSTGTHVLTAVQAPAPALTSCGTTPTIVGNDVRGTITTGTSAATCVLTFTKAWGAAPDCVVSWHSVLATMTYSVSITAISITQTSASNNLISYICLSTN